MLKEKKQKTGKTGILLHRDGYIFMQSGRKAVCLPRATSIHLLAKSQCPFLSNAASEMTDRNLPHHQLIYASQVFQSLGGRGFCHWDSQ